jgi:hypothetical protein
MGAATPARAQFCSAVADLELVAHSCTLSADTIEVGQEVLLECDVIVHNNGPCGPVGAYLDWTAIGLWSGCEIIESGPTPPLPLAVCVSEVLPVELLTLQCFEPGDYEVRVESRISPLDSWVVSDPDDTNNSFVGSTLQFTVSPSPVSEVDIDIKPGSYPNSINLTNNGLIPVAILTTDDFDATTVDAESAVFGPGEAEKGHKQAHVEDVDGDGDLDLLLHFRTLDTGIAPGDTEACLMGQTYDGIPLIGCDSVSTIPG